MRQRALPLRWEALLVVLITLLAGVLRFSHLTELPPGLHFDEGFKGVTARGLLAGDPPQLFFESDMGEEPLAMYLVAAALAVAGPEPWAIRLPSAVVGTLTAPLAWWLGREVFGKGRKLRGQVAGLGTALILAVLYWHLSFSRIGMEPILVPFFATGAFASLAWGLNSGRLGAFALAGVALGGSLYTYKAGYFVPVLAGLFLLYGLVVERGFWQRHRRGLLLLGLVALVVAAPIGVYFATHPAHFLQRPTSVALGGEEGVPLGSLQAWGQNLGRVLGMFFVRGDANPRSNLPGRPALDPFLALLFLVGCARSLVGFRRPLTGLPLLWLGVMVAPTLITEHAPHFGRAIGATPALALLCALGGWTLGEGALRLRRRWIAVTVALFLGGGLLFSVGSTVHDYFLAWGRSPDLFYAYDVGLAESARRIDLVPEEEHVYLTPTDREHFTLQFLVGRPFATFDGRAGLVVPPPGHAATMVVLLREDAETLPLLQRLRPDGQVGWQMNDGYDRPYAAAYQLPARETPAPEPDHRMEAVVGDSIRLLGYEVDAERVSPGDTVRLTLFWEALAPLDTDYTVFSHLLGGHNPATQGPMWAGHDSPPLQGHYPTTVWQPGEVILDVHPLAIPTDTPPGEYELEAGLYELETMTRLPAYDALGQRLPDDRVLLGSIVVVGQ